MTIYKWIFPLKMAIFNSYVKLPEGKTRGSSRLSKWLDRQVSACQAHHGRSKAAAKDAGSDSKFRSQKTGTFLPMENHPKVVTRNWYELMKLRLLSCFLILRSSFGDDEVVVLQHAHLVKWCRPADCARPRIMLRMPMLLYLLFSGCSQSCFVPRLQKIPSGKRSYRKSSRKSPLLMGKSTILTGPFSIATLVITRG